MCLRTREKIEKRSANKNTYLFLLLLIIAVGLVLRIWGTWFGLPYVYHPDENKEVLRALRLGMGSFDLSRVAKGGYFYLLFLEYAIYFIILKIAGEVRSAINFAHMFIANPSAFYLSGRITTALIGTLNVFITYIIGKEAYSSRVGVLAALFLAFNFLHAQSSHYVTVDVPMTCLATLGLMYAVRICQSAKIRYYILAAIFTGLAIQTKAPAVVLLVPILVAHFSNVTREEKRVNHILDKKLLTGCVVLLIVLFLGSPGLILNLPAVSKAFLRIFAGTKASLSSGVIDRANSPNLFFYYLNVLQASMGLPLLIISLLGIGYGFYRHKKEDILLIAFFLSYYCMISISRHPLFVYPRYMIPVLPVLAILGARAIEELGLKLFSDKAKILISVGACMLVVLPGYKTVRQDYLISHKDTRTFAKEWIEENIPNGSKVVIEGFRTKPRAGTVQLQNYRENIIRAIKNYRETEPAKAKYFELELKVLRGITYDLVTVNDRVSEAMVKSWDLDYFKRLEVEYMILRPAVFQKNIDERANFYQSLKFDPQVTLVKKFEPNPFNRPGPAIEIYQIEKEPNFHRHGHVK